MNTLVLLLPLLVAVAPTPTPVPQASLTPEAVVRLQLDALRDNNRPSADSGIATVFGFASPPNRAQTGPLPRFVKMIRSNYADLLNHREARLFKTQFEAGQAIQPVEVISKDGASFRYLFILRRYDLPQGRCWLTEGVVGKPVDAQRSAAWTPQYLALQ